MAYAVDTSVYKGPIEKLLELVEEKKLEITEVNLAEVTGDFLAYFETLRQAQGKEQQDFKSIVADFLVVASRLLLIKSRVLLPSLELDEEEEEDIRDLEFRLKLYKELKGTKAYVRENWSEVPFMAGREFLMSKEPMFLPPKKIRPVHLQKAMVRVFDELQQFLMPEEKIERVVMKLGDKIQELLNRLTEEPTDVGHLDGKKTREEVVTLFIAVLHLVRDHFVDVNQEDEYGKIFIAKRP